MDGMDETGGGWVFGYGSLMWRPGFPFLERRGAELKGRRRAFCIFSVHHRGTPERPGLVLGLLPGPGVRGKAFRVSASDWAAAHAYLLEREQPTETYVEARVSLTLDDGRQVEALAFLSDQAHPQWAGELPVERQAELIAGASGRSGDNADYLRDLLGHLRAEGCVEPEMEAVLARVEALTGRRGVRTPPRPDPRAGP